jgi:hypothetical protein
VVHVQSAGVYGANANMTFNVNRDMDSLNAAMGNQSEKIQ